MASVTLINTPPVLTQRIEKEQVFNTSFKPGQRISVVEEILPFRVRFTAIQVPGYRPGTVPAIPLQIIGYSNYIL